MDSHATSLVCIVCPRGCALDVAREGGSIRVRGHACRRGIGYARTELSDPRRTITTTVPVHGGATRLVPVRSGAPIPRALIGQALRELKALSLAAPVAGGQVVVVSLAGSGISAVATRDVPGLD